MVCCGLKPRAGRMEGIDESTELWWYPLLPILIFQNKGLRHSLCVSDHRYIFPRKRKRVKEKFKIPHSKRLRGSIPLSDAARSLKLISKTIKTIFRGKLIFSPKLCQNIFNKIAPKMISMSAKNKLCEDKINFCKLAKNLLFPKNLNSRVAMTTILLNLYKEEGILIQQHGAVQQVAMKNFIGTSVAIMKYQNIVGRQSRMRG